MRGVALALLAALASCEPPPVMRPAAGSPPAPVASSAGEASSPASKLLGPTAAIAAAAGAGPLSLLASELIAEGDRLGAFVELSAGSCLLATTRGSEGVEDLDLLAFDDEGTPLGVDEGQDATPSLLLCPPLAGRAYLLVRVASGRGLVALGTQPVALEAALRVGKAVGAKGRPGASSREVEAWPGLDAKTAEVKRLVGGAWGGGRRMALPADTRSPGRLTEPVERCLLALVTPSSETSELDVLLLDAEGRTVARASEVGRERVSVVCSPIPTRVSLEVRPRLGAGVAAVVLLPSIEGSEADMLARPERIDVYPTGDAAAAMARPGPRPKARGYGAAAGQARGSAAAGRRSALTLSLPAGCARVDVVGGAPLAGVVAELWSAQGTLLGRGEGGGRVSLFACGPGGAGRLEVEALQRPGPFSVEIRPDRGDPRLTGLAAGRLLDRFNAAGEPIRAQDLAGVKEMSLDAQTPGALDGRVPEGKCIDVGAALGAGGAGVEVRLLDPTSREELSRGAAAWATTARLCAGSSPRAFSAEIRLNAGKAEAIAATHLVGKLLTESDPLSRGIPQVSRPISARAVVVCRFTMTSYRVAFFMLALAGAVGCGLETQGAADDETADFKGGGGKSGGGSGGASGGKAGSGGVGKGGGGPCQFPSDCDDGNPCTADECVNGKCQAKPNPKGVSCTDGNKCNGDEVCNDKGQCQPGLPVKVDDNNLCTTDTCDPLKGTVSHQAVSADDKNPCTLDSCDPTKGPVHSLKNLDDKNPCTIDVCDPQTGEATHVEIDTNDGNPCTVDACDPATGAITHTQINVDDGDVCTTDECNPATGQVEHKTISMDDGDACTIDACDKNFGVTHEKIDPGDGDPCTVDGCDPLSGPYHKQVVNCVPCTPQTAAVACNDGNPCTVELCINGECLNQAAVAGSPCDDGNKCNGVATCDAQGKCKPGTPVQIDDGDACTIDVCDLNTGDVGHKLNIEDDKNPCTVDTCNPQTGATTHTQIDINDGNLCTIDACDPTTGAIAHTQVDVDDGNECTDDACDPTTGSILHVPINVSDGNGCTDDACIPGQGIKHTPIPNCVPCEDLAKCNLGNPCVIYTCINGQCNETFAPLGTSCSDGDKCNGLETCNGSGTCQPGSPVNPDDSNPCTTDACNPATGSVSNTPIPGCTPCGSPAPCNDQNPCTTDACQGGVCKNTKVAAGTACHDNNKCNGDETCDSNGSCKPGTPKNIDDQNACTTDSCNPATGVVSHNPTTNCTPCQNAGQCDDQNPCTTDACVAGVCSYTNAANGSPCADDGDKCNGAEQCDTGVCVHNAPVTCGSPPACRDAPGTCDPQTGACSFPLKSAGSTCDDGNKCTTSDACDSAGTCKGTAVVCGPSPDACRATGVCNATTGLCDYPLAPVGTACDDGAKCTSGDTCDSAGTCKGTAVVCGQPPVCRVSPGTCDQTDGLCDFPPAQAGASCDDSDKCTDTDACDGNGVCKGTPKVCQPLSQCHSAGTCNTTTGVCSDPPKAAGASCDDSDKCTDADACDGSGVCKGTPKACNTPPSACHQPTGTCKASDGTCEYLPKADNDTCDDGNKCTTGDKCTAGVCQGQPKCGMTETCNATTGDCIPSGAGGAAGAAGASGAAGAGGG